MTSSKLMTSDSLTTTTCARSSARFPSPRSLAALSGLTPAFRKQLLSKLSTASASRLEAQINAHGPVTPETAQVAQRALIETLYRLSRGGQVAFDVPEDMVA